MWKRSLGRLQAENSDPHDSLPARVQVNAKSLLSRRVSPPGNKVAFGESVSISLRIEVSPEGSVKSVSMISGDAAAAETAMTNIEKWRFRPTLLYGQPVQATSIISLGSK